MNLIGETIYYKHEKLKVKEQDNDRITFDYYNKEKKISLSFRTNVKFENKEINEKIAKIRENLFNNEIFESEEKLFDEFIEWLKRHTRLPFSSILNQVKGVIAYCEYHNIQMSSLAKNIDEYIELYNYNDIKHLTKELPKKSAINGIKNFKNFIEIKIYIPYLFDDSYFNDRT